MLKFEAEKERMSLQTDYCQHLASLLYERRTEASQRNPSKRIVHSTLRDVAKETGISPSTLCRIERGEMPDLETFRKLCIWLGVSADEILGIRKEEVSVPCPKKLADERTSK